MFAGVVLELNELASLTLAGRVLAHNANRFRPFYHVGLVSVGSKPTVSTSGQVIPALPERGRRLRRLERRMTSQDFQGGDITAFLAASNWISLKPTSKATSHVGNHRHLRRRGSRIPPLAGGLSGRPFSAESKIRRNRPRERSTNSNLKVLVITVPSSRGLEIKN